MRYETGSVLGVGNVDDAGKCAAGCTTRYGIGSLGNEN